MKSIITSWNLFLCFCMLVVLPVATMCLFAYLFSLLNGQTITSPALRVTLIGFGGLALLWWLIMGIRSFFRQLRIAHESKAAAAAPVAAPAIKQRATRKKINLRPPKWVRVTALAMLIAAVTGCMGMAWMNPSYEEFKAFTPERSTSRHYVQWTKLHNYLLWSVYQKNVYEWESSEGEYSLTGSQQYRGILLNFTPVH